MILEQLLAPVPGGTGRYSRELAAGLHRTAEAGDGVSGWVAWHRDIAAARIDGLPGPRRLPLGGRALAYAWGRPSGPAPRGDVIHAPTPLMPPRRRTPVIVTVHDAVPWTHPETLTPHGAQWHRRMIELAAQHADAVTVPTATVAGQLAEQVPGLTADRVRVLGAGVAPRLLAAPDDAARAAVRAGLRLPEHYLVTVATLEPRKGLDVLIGALARLGDEAPPLVVVGQPGWGGVDLDVAAAAAGLRPDRVLATGRVGDRELGVILREATALVAPSRAEGFGLPLAEAMAVGLPVVASDIPVFAEVTDGAALLVPPDDAAALADALAHIVADEAERARLAAAGRVRARAFDWDEVARRAWALYRAVAAT